MSHALTPDQIDAFDREGYLVVRGLLDRERDLDPIVAEFAPILDALADHLHAEGRIASTHADLPFSERLSTITAESGAVHTQWFDCSLPQGNVKADTPFHTGPAVFRLIRNEAILDMIASLIGPEIHANPVQHVRLKPPERVVPIDPATGHSQLGATAWHQDNGVVTEDADETETITVWLPLTDATEHNGCMIVAPRRQQDGLLPHCPNGSPARNRNGGIGLHIPEQHLIDAAEEVTLPMNAGDVLLMHRRTPHASHSNSSDHVRWSFDLRYNPIGQPTGRSAFPGFVARSANDPASELHDPEAWHRLWLDARAHLAASADPTFNRWNVDSIACA